MDTPFAVPTRAAGLERLAAFVPRAGAYGRERNHDRGPGNHRSVSCLSPYLRHRLVREEEVLAAVLERFAPSTVEKFVDEVFWRAYFKGYLERRPWIWRDYNDRLAADRVAAERDRALHARLAAAVAGTTGIDAFDAWARELVETGYLHNHARMWFASIWIFTLELPWTLGADFFYRHLLDGDPASNTLSWRWVAGLHTRGKTYLARADNIDRYTGGRFRPTGLAGSATPLEEPPQAAARAVPPAAETIDDTPCVLLVTEEDLAVEHGPLAAADVRAVVTAPSVEARTDIGAAPAVVAFTRAAVADGGARAATAFGAPLHAAETIDPEALADLARTHGVERIATAYAPVGPVRSALARAKGSLGARGIALATVRRGYDSRAWPYADAGFFKLRKRIPRLLETALGQDPAAGTGAADGRGAA